MSTPSANYTNSGEQFSIPTDETEQTDPTLFIISHLRATENHTHASTRGLRVPTAGLATNAVTQNGFAQGSTVAPTTTSASYADLADMSVTLSTTGGDLMVWFTGTFTHSTPSNSITVAISLDGAAEVGPMNTYPPIANYQQNVAVVYRFSAPSTASHTIKVRWATSGATATAVSTLRQLFVMEVKR